MSEIYDLHQGTLPLLVSAPHCGTGLLPGLAGRLGEDARALPDTDWHIPRLYDFARELGASFLAARLSRYVIDLNRPPDGSSLYPGQATTELCPSTLFDGRPLYREGAAPDAAEVAERRHLCWQPYHDALASELARIRARHGYALLFDAHSICSVVPRLFEGRLPDINLGTAKGASCHPGLGERLLAAANDAGAKDGFTAVLNGRFVGGYITRHYGRPDQGVQAVQLELAQVTYMREAAPFDYLPAAAARIRPVLRHIVETFIAAGAPAAGCTG